MLNFKPATLPWPRETTSTFLSNLWLSAYCYALNPDRPRAWLWLHIYQLCNLGMDLSKISLLLGLLDSNEKEYTYKRPLFSHSGDYMVNTLCICMCAHAGWCMSYMYRSEDNWGVILQEASTLFFDRVSHWPRLTNLGRTLPSVRFPQPIHFLNYRIKILIPVKVSAESWVDTWEVLWTRGLPAPYISYANYKLSHQGWLARTGVATTERLHRRMEEGWVDS